MLLLGLTVPAPVDAGVSVAARHHVTVTVRTPRGETRVASGTIVNGDGLVVTAAHVARSTRNSAKIVAFDGSIYQAKILRVLPATDLAFVQISRPWDFPVRTLAVDAAPRTGEHVIGVGIHRGHKALTRTGTVISPRYRKRFRFGSFGFRDPVVLNMRVESGFSGGPVLNTQDQWLGIVVGYQFMRQKNGEDLNSGESYVLPAPQILDDVR